ncbi:hypothetical protein D1BOALGB6SA_10850 [Olavius sp. associated proteobacterium Delta 1]|nr:hypothetical protein D1BOALGB6SA_10850 [Olavius sp. associated proteobacterium Delta 1]
MNTRRIDFYEGGKMQIKLTCFEVRKFGEEKWQEIPERMVLERLADSYYLVTPIITKMLQGNEIVAETEIYRIRS